VSERDNDPATGRPGRPPGIAPAQAQQASAHDSPAVSDQHPSIRCWNIGRDAVGVVLLLLALAFPWNLYFGLGIANSSKPVLWLLILATLLSFGSVAATYAGPRRLSRPHVNPVLAGRLRLSLNTPYLLLVFAFVAFDAVQTIRYGGSINVPGGLGPGAWLGVAGSLLCAQPVITEATPDNGRFARWLVGARVVGYASIVGAALSFVFVLYWRVRYALPSSAGTAGFGKQNVAVIVTAVVYGVVAVIAIVVASSWIVQGGTPFRLVTVVLGASTLMAGLIVWILPIGREIDGFHGIAQNTSTAGVGFEGYAAWAAAAAILAPLTLFQAVSTRPTDRNRWLGAARKGLLLIVVWCAGSMVMRITDLLVAVNLDFPFSRYDSMTLAAFDLLTAVVAVWLRTNLVNLSLPVRLVWSVCGLLVVLAVARIVMGVVLAPRFLAPKYPAGMNSAVYGNNLAQQITSTFDVVLCGLALYVLAVATLAGRHRRRVMQSPRQTRVGGRPATRPTRPPRMHRPTEDATHQSPTDRPKIYRAP
jgi:uncharacterized membrane protein